MAGTATWARWSSIGGLVPALTVGAILLCSLRRPRATVTGLTLLALAPGLLRASAHSAAQPPNIATFGEGIELRVVGRIVRLPDSDNRRPLRLEIQSAVPRDSADLTGEVATLPKVGGRLHVYSFSRAYSVGQTLQATGTLRLYDRPPTDPKRSPSASSTDLWWKPNPDQTRAPEAFWGNFAAIWRTSSGMRCRNLTQPCSRQSCSESGPKSRGNY